MVGFVYFEWGVVWCRVFGFVVGVLVDVDWFCVFVYCGK